MKKIIAKWLRSLADKLYKEKIEVIEPIFESTREIIPLSSRVENSVHVTDRDALVGIQQWLARELGRGLLREHLIKFQEFHYPDKHIYTASIDVIEPEGCRVIIIKYHES